jgi:uncharacterized membrane protein (UPF0127 family)
MTTFRGALVLAILLIGNPSMETWAQDRALVLFKTAPLSIETAAGKHRFTVELALNDRQQAQGLMYRRRLARDAGMLFVYRAEQPVSMWMKNTLIPLDMVFIAADGRIKRIAQRTVPMSLETISSEAPVRAVLELNAGTAARLGIEPGDRVNAAALGR